MDLKDESLKAENESSNLDHPSSPDAMATCASSSASVGLMSMEKEYGITTLKSMSGTLCSIEDKISSHSLLQHASTLSGELGDGEPQLKRIKLEPTTDSTQVSSAQNSGESTHGNDRPAKGSLSKTPTAQGTPKTVKRLPQESSASAESRPQSALASGSLKPVSSNVIATKSSQDANPTASAAGTSAPPKAAVSAASTKPSQPITPAATVPSGGTEVSSRSSSAGKPVASPNPALSSHAAAQIAASPCAPPPLKSVKMSHLRQKYTAQLQYMLREFRKLERQLLGAKGIEESSGSRERREKLHSFILHLEDTIRQIDLGCKLEAEGKSTAMVGVSSSSVGGVSTGSGEELSPSADEELQKKLANSALTKLTKEKEEEENVQKLEEHILANLLPVKARLTKQLAAQQGASRNPAGMPAARRGMLQPSAAAEKGKGTFAAAAEQRRKQAEAVRAAQTEAEPLPPVSEDATQFGKPLKGGGSSLTQKLHGATLGSKNRPHGHGVGSSMPASPGDTTDGASPDEASRKRKIFYAGMTPGSQQVHSSVSAAADVHGMVIENPALLSASSRSKEDPVAATVHSAAGVIGTSSVSAQKSSAPQHLPHPGAPISPKSALKPISKEHAKGITAKAMIIPSSTVGSKSSKRRCDDFILSDEERKKLRKKRRRKQKRREARRLEIERQRQMLLQQQAVQASQLPNKGPLPLNTGKKTGKGSMAAKNAGKKKGPRTVEYICALCSEAYGSTCDCNPWWALTSHDCPKCRKTQIPRVDITSPANAIEYHPALLAHAEDTSGGNSGGGNAGVATNTGGGMSVMHINPSHISPTLPVSAPLASSKYSKFASDSDSGSDFIDDSDGGPLSEDSMDSDDSDAGMLRSMTPAEEAEMERFGREYNGPTLSEKQSARLLILLSHASTCPGRHKSAKHRDVCHSTKFLMLHIRDCPGTTSTFDICPFPWCRKVKHLLYHLVACPRPLHCAVCSPPDLSPNLSALAGLNEFRRKKHRERMIASLAAAAAAKAKAASAPKKPPPARTAVGLKKSGVNATKPQYKSWVPATKTKSQSQTKKPVVAASASAAVQRPAVPLKRAGGPSVPLKHPGAPAVLAAAAKAPGATVKTAQASAAVTPATKPPVATIPVAAKPPTTSAPVAAKSPSTAATVAAKPPSTAATVTAKSPTTAAPVAAKPPAAAAPVAPKPQVITAANPAALVASQTPVTAAPIGVQPPTKAPVQVSHTPNDRGVASQPTPSVVSVSGSEKSAAPTIPTSTASGAARAAASKPVPSIPEPAVKLEAKAEVGNHGGPKDMDFVVEPLPEASPSLDSVALPETSPPPLGEAALDLEEASVSPPHVEIDDSPALAPSADPVGVSSTPVAGVLKDASPPQAPVAEVSKDPSLPQEPLTEVSMDISPPPPPVAKGSEDLNPSKAPVMKFSKDLPPNLKFPQLASGTQQAKLGVVPATLIEDHGSSGLSEPENESEICEADEPKEGAAKDTNKMEQKGKNSSGTGGNGEAKGVTSQTSTAPSTSPAEAKASCSKEMEKKTESVRIGC